MSFGFTLMFLTPDDRYHFVSNPLQRRMSFVKQSTFKKNEQIKQLLFISFIIHVHLKRKQ